MDINQKKGWWQSEVMSVTPGRRTNVSVLISATGSKAVTQTANLRQTLIWENGVFKALQGLQASL